MGLFSIFSKSAPPDYETLLARLATDISEAKTHLSEIRLRERRFSLLVNAYGVAAWAVWVGLWWVNGLPLGLIGLSHRDIEGRVISLGGIMGGPVFIYLLNRLVHIYFKRQRTHEETHLRALLTQQRKHLEEIKKATNYDSTRKLIEQYDDPSAGTRSAPGPNQAGGIHPSPRTPQRKVLDSPSPAGTKSAGPGGTPRAPGHLIGAGGTPGPNSPIPIPEGLSSDQAAALQMQIHAIQPVLPTPEKRWYDRVVDFILGDDPSQAAQSKYALVCGECFRHNGLVGSKYEWERMQWICPRCNHLNPSPLSKLQNTSSTQPLPSSPAPAPTVTSAPSPSIVKRAPASPRPRRQIGGGGNGTPRSSRLSKEVFSASSEDDDDEEEDADADELDRGDNMDVDMEGK